MRRLFRTLACVPRRVCRARRGAVTGRDGMSRRPAGSVAEAGVCAGVDESRLAVPATRFRGRSGPRAWDRSSAGFRSISSLTRHSRSARRPPGGSFAARSVRSERGELQLSELLLRRFAVDDQFRRYIAQRESFQSVRFRQTRHERSQRGPDFDDRVTEFVSEQIAVAGRTGSR